MSTTVVFIALYTWVTGSRQNINKNKNHKLFIQIVIYLKSKIK